jgi:hypothetical protein
MLHSFANKRSSKAAITPGALAHTGVLNNSGIAKWDSVALPAKSALGNPSTLSVCGGNPDLNALVGVVDLQSPFSSKFGDVRVIDQSSLEWIYHNQIGFSQDQLWSNPQQVGSGSNKNRDRKINKQITSCAWIENQLSQKDSIECECQSGPNQVALGTKNSVHESIIAGSSAVGIGN